MTTASELSNNELQMDISTMPQYTAISAHSLLKGTPNDIGEWLRLLQPDSRAKDFRQRAGDWVNPAIQIDGRKQSRQLELFDHDTYYWKTPQEFSHLSTMRQYLQTCRNAVIDLHRRHVYPVGLEMPRISVIGGGLWYRPCARDWRGYTRRPGESLCNQLKQLFPETSGKPHPEFIEEVMNWPTGWSGLEPL